jgi:hypothetical protein
MKRLLAPTIAVILSVEVCAQTCFVSATITSNPRALSGAQINNQTRRSVDLRVRLLTPLSTKTNRKGDTVTAQVMSPEEFAGDFLEGKVTESKSGKSIKGSSHLSFVFHTLLHKEEPIRVEASIKSFRNSKGQEWADEEGNVVEKKNNLPKILAGSILGAIAGAAIGGGKGAAAGGAAGAAIALVLVKFSVKGANVSFAPGSEFIVETYTKNRSGGGGISISSQQGGGRPYGRVEHPSSRFRTYNGSVFRISVPDNWRELPANDNVTFVPEGAYGEAQGRFEFSHGIQVGTMRATTRSLQEATEELISGLAQSNPRLRKSGEYERQYLGRRDGLSVLLSNVPTATGRPEIITIYTTILRNGTLFYLVAVAPQDEYQDYERAFANIFRTVDLND